MGIVLSNIIAIYRRELQSYFVSPLAYVIAGIFWFISGLFLVMILLGPGGILPTITALDLQGQQLGVPVPPIDVPYEFVRAFLDRMGWLLLFVLPILSMGLYAEERKRGTLELLATSPVTNWAVAVGKLLGVLTFFITMVVPLLALEAFVIQQSNPPMAPTMLLFGHLGLILLAAAILSLGMFISSLTDSTILSAVFTFAVILLLLFVDLLAKTVPGPIGEALSYISLLKHFNTFIEGIFDTSALLLFLSYIFLGIFLTSQSIDALRFQRQ
ncbi:putative ABC-2 type transport system permease protein [Tolypothrix tenuis PCC 7101]|uniref:Putative ABC-2 type transport system permease protein n=1 Tax=Tolypothrix tenuis PCC 7101 TaxID=231146 RepID=A0A1Z4MVH7_9CYAN|nr:ABC transporter permease [Tolypothrix sp. PCC 7910]MBD2235708.1 ABC transporter permease subunit [Aulosira sp. FACHB-113]BAY33112.1 putative ABC-2 type transport system permease protein [Nostoc carneum NIES-2107]BAY97437.1 putative ABC-2 type transport system permease protein [Tolypothrix tenuis PCC 7101]BAZ72054.1 putative ABC-2 type transport system permease protein [Aulosira laxa NIES-50]QIR38193.1 ABC transporter permease subunit [Tolypothrix sp. PCC 7910]